MFRVHPSSTRRVQRPGYGCGCASGRFPAAHRRRSALSSCNCRPHRVRSKYGQGVRSLDGWRTYHDQAPRQCRRGHRPHCGNLFPADIEKLPRNWVEKRFHDLRYRNVADRGGHFLDAGGALVLRAGGAAGAGADAAVSSPPVDPVTTLASIREQARFELELLHQRVNTLLAAEAFLTIAYTATMNSQGAWAAVVAPVLAVLGLLLAGFAWPGVSATAGLVMLWTRHVGDILEQHPQTRALWSAVQVERSRREGDQRRSLLLFRCVAPIFAVVWIVLRSARSSCATKWTPSNQIRLIPSQSGPGATSSVSAMAPIGGIGSRFIFRVKPMGSKACQNCFRSPCPTKYRQLRRSTHLVE